MIHKKIKFLADESCDFVVVRSLRSAGYDVVSVAESFPSISDIKILRKSVEDQRMLLTEDKDFGEWVFAHREDMEGVILIRFPATLRYKLGKLVTLLIKKYSSDLQKNFTVLEPGRARIHKKFKLDLL